MVPLQKPIAVQLVKMVSPSYLTFAPVGCAFGHRYHH
jgi:hypothetical protein